MTAAGEHGRTGYRSVSPRLRNIAWCALLTLLVLAMQYRSGAYSADLAFDHDEPEHAVSALMVHDYLVQSLPHNPLTFARAFREHYPKVALVHWPPLFYVGEAVWMLAAGRTRAAMLLFVALNGAALIASLFFLVRRRCSTSAALVTVAVALHASVFQEMLFCVRPDLLESLLLLWAAVCCGEFMIAYSRKSRLRFLIFAALALMVHWRAGVLLLVPFALVPLRRPKRKWRWTALAVCVALFMIVPGMAGAADPYHWRLLALHIGQYLFGAAFLSAWVGAALAAVGIVLIFRRTRQQPFWAAMAALAASGLLFYLLVPIHWDYRLLLPTLQAIAALAGGGVQVLLDRYGKANGVQRPWLAPVLSACAVVWIGASLGWTEKKPSLGYRNAVTRCLLCGHDTVLVAGDPLHEGGLIAEASLIDPRRTRTVLRGSKELASSSWSGKNYRLLFATPQDILRDLAQKHVTLVVVQNGSSRPEAGKLEAALTSDPKAWELDQSAPPLKGASVYRSMAAR